MPKLEVQPFQIGDKVTSDYHGPNESNIIRKITMIEKNDRYGSGWAASADDGGICECCKRSLGRFIDRVDSPWFKIYEEAK